MNYNDDIELAKQNGIIDAADIFDFREAPKEELYVIFYEFCREHLNDQSENYNTSPSIFLFTNFLYPNAKAQYSNNIYSVQINIGLMEKCEQSFLRNKEFDEYLNEKYRGILKKYDNPITVLAYQVATQFTYYHEYAHLIQFEKKKTELSLQERYENTEGYIEIKHILEINADTYAALALASHIQQYIKKCFGEDLKQEGVEITIVVLCCCLLNHIASFCGDDLANVYFKKQSHPHPLLRLFSVALNLLNYLNQSLFFKSKGVSIEIGPVFNKALNLYRELEENQIFNTKLGDAIVKASTQQSEIIKYLGHLIESEIEDYNDAIKEWNRHSKNTQA